MTTANIEVQSMRDKNESEAKPTSTQRELHDSESKKWKLIGIISLVFLFIALIIIIVLAVVSSESDGKKNSDMHASCSLDNNTISDVQWDEESDGVNPIKYGLWQTIIPDPDKSASIESIIGMQTVHTALLPSGKVLLFSGSAWRNSLDQMHNNTYPTNIDPSAGKGLFNFYENPFVWDNAEWYYSQVNFNGIYDPSENTFFRIPHPLPIQPNPDNSTQFIPTDLFCSGQYHVRDGNVLWIGGTQYYYPYRTGNRATHIFSWTKEAVTDWTLFNWTTMPSETSEFYPFTFSGLTHRGRWYPHSVPLLDGRLVIFSGFIGFDKINNYEMYEFETNKEVEFFNYDNFLSSGIDNAWYSINAENMTDSPFATPLIYLPPKATPPECTTPRECRAYHFDAFKLYPNNYLLKDGRIYLTREGDWNSLRTVDAVAIRRVNFTYFMSIGGTKDEPTISWSRGPDRPSNITMSGTSVRDPNNGNINRYGGMPIITGGTMLPGLISIDDIDKGSKSDLFRRTMANQWAGSRGTRTFDLFTIPKDINDIGTWTLEDDNYLGGTIDDDRTMFYSLILPTKQILIINGGNYDFYAGVFNPILLTPIYKNNVFTGNYTKQRMAAARQSRLYHSGAILLSDARVMVYGGNAARATIDVEASEWDQTFDYTNYNGQLKPNLDRVNTFTYFYDDSRIGDGPDSTPAENWIMEMYHPPYLFIDESRKQVEITEIRISSSSTSYIVSKVVAGKTYYLIHSSKTYNIKMIHLPDSTTCNLIDASLVIIKLGAVTHGWDSGQSLYSIQFDAVDDSDDEIKFVTPDFAEANIPPAYYNMFYVDCMGKPSIAASVRFDDDVDEPF
eukprot:476215_1